MMRSIGRSLELYYIDGRPDGMLTAEMFNWTGHVLMTPRTQITTALARAEASYSGIYLLLGEQDGDPLCYIGEGEDIAKRIRSHDVQKDWWASAILVTAAANKLNKAHIRYLEARLIAEAKSIGRTLLDNSISPALPILSEAEQGNMESFLENLLVVLPALRVDMFIQRVREAVELQPVLSPARSLNAPLGVGLTDPHFLLKLTREDFSAEAVLNEDGEFVVLAGSQARNPQNLAGYRSLYDELVRAGVISRTGDGSLQFSTNYAFKSPSAAASVALGRSTNGAWEWKHSETGVPYKEWEAKRVDASFEDLLG